MNIWCNTVGAQAEEITGYDEFLAAFCAGGYRDAVEEFKYLHAAGTEFQFGHGGDSVDEDGAPAQNAPKSIEDETASLLLRAREEGTRQGAEMAQASLETALQEERARIAATLKEFELERRDYFARVEPELVNLAIAIAEKILHHESTIDRTVLAGVVRATMESFQQNSKAVVRIRPEEAEAWREYLKLHALEQVEVIPDDSLDFRGCLLETELGTADLSMQSQFDEIKQGFFDLLAQGTE